MTQATTLTSRTTTRNDELAPVQFVDCDEFRRLAASDALSSCTKDTYVAMNHASRHRERERQGRLLTPQGESHLFRKMNYLRCRANQVSQESSRKRPNRSLQVEYQRLLDQAEVARAAIIEANTRLVASIANKFANAHLDFDELVSEGNMILVNAVDKFDYSRGFRFSTYATHAIQRHFFRLMKRRQRRRNHELATPSDILAEIAPSSEQEQPLDHRVAEKLIARFDDCLDEREAVILRERFGLNRRQTSSTLKVVADQVGLSKERVRQLQQSAIEKLQDLAIQMRLRLDPSV